MSPRKMVAAVLVLAAMVVGLARADAQAQQMGQTPPRLSFIDGEVSYWRPGAEDWVAAQVNTLFVQAVPSLIGMRKVWGGALTVSGLRDTHVIMTMSPGTTCVTSAPTFVTSPVDS